MEPTKECARSSARKGAEVWIVRYGTHAVIILHDFFIHWCRYL